MHVAARTARYMTVYVNKVLCFTYDKFILLCDCTVCVLRLTCMCTLTRRCCSHFVSSKSLLLSAYLSYAEHIGMGDRNTKLRKLNAFRRSKPHCSASALGEILTDIKNNGLPDLTDRRSMREGRNLLITAQSAYGPILQSIDCVNKAGATTALHVACPFASLSAAIAESASFRGFLKQQLLLHPPSPDAPWNIILYSDEVTPGNPLATSNRRKFQSLYWSFLEFDATALSHEESWFVLMTEFSTRVSGLSAGLSQAFAAAIKCFFQPGGFNMMDGGMHVEIDGDSFRLFARLGTVLQDGGAHKAVWQARGDGASKFCMLCKNLFTNDSTVVDEDGRRLLKCDQIKLDELEASTDAELRTNARYLEQESAMLSPDEFNLLQQALGLTYAKYGLLLDRSLDRIVKPTEVYMHDYMHALYVDGALNLVIYLCFEAFIASGETGVYESFSDYVSKWKFPGRLHAYHLEDIFTTERRDKHRKAKHIKCQASGLLSLLGPMLLYVQQVLAPMGSNNAACDALRSMIELSQLTAATARINVSPARLLSVVHRCLDAFVHAFGFEWLTPKCHWLLHLPETLERNGRLLNCFVLERKHKTPKRYATELANISGEASKSLLSEVVCHHLASLNDSCFKYGIGLVKGRAAPKKTRRLILEALGLEDTGMEVLTANEARFNKLGACRQDDVVLLQDGNAFRAGRIRLHFATAGECVSMVQAFALHRQVPETALAIWRVSDGPFECWETKAILAAVEYCVYPDGNIGTILPIEYA